MEEGMYKTMYSTGCVSPSSMDYQKSIKLIPPLRQIVSSRGSITYCVAKVKDVTLLPGECLSSHNVTSLLTSVPLDPALNIIKDLLEHDETLSNRTVLSVQHIIELLGFCLHNTYFSFQNRFY